MYQRRFVVGNGISEQEYFKRTQRRQMAFYVKRDNTPWLTQLHSDRVYTIDHAKKTYTVEQIDQKDPAYFNNLTWGFFRGAYF